MGGFRENHDRFTALDASLLGLSFEGDRAHTVFEWGPPPKPGKVGARKKTEKAQKAEAS